MKPSAVLLPSLALLLLAACSPHGSEHATRPERPAAAVRLSEVHEATLPYGQRLPATVHPAEEAAIAAKIMATVSEAEIAIGQSVRAGDPLVRLQADEMQARLAQAEAAMAQIERNLERERALLSQGATTAETVRSLEDEQRLAAARLAEARTLLSYTTVTAPYDGIVTAKYVRRGDLATPGTPLLEIQSQGPREVWVQVPDSLAAQVVDAPIAIDADGAALEGTLKEWSPAADPSSRTRLAKIALPASAPLRSGQYVEVIWPAGLAHSLTVPSAAISRVGQMEQVFVVENGRAQLRLVRTGARRAEATEIIAGLLPGEIVALPLETELRDGQPVEVRP